MVQKPGQDPGRAGKCIRRRAGIHLVRVKPCFSFDAKYIFVAADTCLLIYSTKTGELIHRLNNDCQGQIVSMFANNVNKLQLITVTCEGVFSYWDYEDGILIRDVPLGIRTMFAYPGASANHFYLAVPRKSDRKNNDLCRLERIKISSSGGEVTKRNVLILEVRSDEKMTAVHTNLVASVFDYILTVIDVRTFYYRRHLISDAMVFTCVAWHPLGFCLATGDSVGRIILWYNIVPDPQNSYSRPVRHNMHWHSNPVGDIAFSPAGNYLFSGGGECVLLKWSINTNGKPYFLPRMGLPIRFVVASTDNSFVVTAHIDNSLSVVDSNLKIVHVIQGLAFSGHWKEASLDPLPVGLLCDPRTKTLVLNGRSGHLQFYNLREDKQLFHLDVSQLNYLSRERNRIIYNVEVIKAAFDHLGKWLATIEYRNDKITSAEIRLKFWKYDLAGQTFCLSTSVEMPHWDTVNCILFQPYYEVNGKSFVPLLATTSNDKRLKFWSFVRDPDDHRQPKFWTCNGIGFYRDLPVGEASFSDDGSVLAVAFEHIVALWLPEDNVLKTTLCCPRSRQSVRQVAFGRGDCSHLVTCSSKESITVWNTLSLSVLWSVNVSVSFLTADFASSVMAVFSTHGELFMFNPSSPEPIEIHKINGDANILTAAFLPVDDGANENPSSTNDGNSHLYFLNDEQMLHSLCEHFSEPSKTQKATVHGNLPLTPFGLLIAEQRKSGVQQVEAKFHELFGSSRKKIVRQILRTPCHVMPPATEICSVFLASILKPLKIDSKKEEDESSESEPERDDDDDDESVGSDVDARGRDVHVKEPAIPETSRSVAEIPRAVETTISDEELMRIENDDYGWIVREISDVISKRW